MIPLSVPVIGAEERAAVDRILMSGYLAGGPEVEAFESEFATAHHVRHAIAVANGTVALQLGLWSLDIGAGDEVIVPSFTFAATTNAVVLTGARPVFADIDPLTFCLSPDTVEPLLSPRTAAVMLVHLYGQPAAAGTMADFCAARGIALIEDAAQAHGAAWQGKPVGGFGILGTFSFYPTKNMTTGEGGMVTTDDPGLAEKLRLLRNHGMKQRYHHDIVGTNARMTDIAAAIGRVQLGRLPEWNRQRRANAAFYDRALHSPIRPPAAIEHADHAYHQYTIRSADRAAVVTALQEAGVGHGVYYPIACHEQDAFSQWRGGPLPETEKATAEVLSIPVRPGLAEAELRLVADTVMRGAGR